MASIKYLSTNFAAVHQFLHDNGISSTFNGASFIIHHSDGTHQIVALLATFTVPTYGSVTISV